MPIRDQDTNGTAFARGAEAHVVELRGECPRQTVNVLDAVSMASNRTRTSLVNEILGEWAAKKIHESNLVNRVLVGNPTHSAGDGGHA